MLNVPSLPCRWSTGPDPRDRCRSTTKRVEEHYHEDDQLTCSMLGLSVARIWIFGRRLWKEEVEGPGQEKSGRAESEFRLAHPENSSYHVCTSV